MATTRENILENQLRKLKFAYYHKQPLMPDDVYDALEDELRTLNPTNPVLAETGAPANLNSPWPQARHIYQMTSLSKCMNMTEFKDWWSTNRIQEAMLTEKRDGLSLAITYDGGKFISAVVRGDGLVGDDITPNVLKMQGVLFEISNKGTVVIHGEIELTQEGLKKARLSRPDKEYANCRNSASGLSREKDAQLAHLLQFTAYGVHGLSKEYKTEALKFVWLEKEGFKVAPPHTLVYTIQEVESLYLRYSNGIRAGLGYDIDGLVIRNNDFLAFEEAGLNAENRPLMAVALKFPPRVVRTKILNIRWDQGDSGRVSPIAEVEPIPCDGSVIRNVNLYNLDFLLKHEITIGAEVEVCKGGDVIPELVRVLKPGPIPFWK